MGPQRAPALWEGCCNPSCCRSAGWGGRRRQAGGVSFALTVSVKVMGLGLQQHHPSPARR